MPLLTNSRAQPEIQSVDHLNAARARHIQIHAAIAQGTAREILEAGMRDPSMQTILGERHG
jgi:hypothetical protein